MESRKSFLLRINPAIYRALEAWAQQEMRSVNGQIEYILKDAVRRRDRKSADGDDAVPGNSGDRSHHATAPQSP
jgi:hypothetical protein